MAVGRSYRVTTVENVPANRAAVREKMVNKQRKIIEIEITQ